MIFLFLFNQQIRNETSCYFVVYLLELHVLTLNFSHLGQMTKYIIYSDWLQFKEIPNREKSDMYANLIKIKVLEKHTENAACYMYM